MQYLGGKSRICKQLALYLNSEIKEKQPERYIEPFCGSCWVVSEITHPIRIALDVHKDLVLLWQELQKGWNPPNTITEEEYQNLKTAAHSALRAFAGFGCSFGGKFFAGYARDPKSDRNYALNTKNSLLKRIEKLKNVYFKCASYDQIPIDKMEKRMIYCDPPYCGTTGYKETPPFNHTHFWDWVRQASLKNWVYVSEYVAPEDFRTVWSIETRTDLEVKSGGKAKRIEKLFQFSEGLT